jgi:hypothetical protein
MSERQPGQNPERYPQLSWGHALMGALEQMTFSRPPGPGDGDDISNVHREFAMPDGAELGVVGSYQGPRKWVVDIQGSERGCGFFISQKEVEVRVLPIGSEIPLSEVAVQSLYRSIVASVPVTETMYGPMR